MLANLVLGMAALAAPPSPSPVIHAHLGTVDEAVVGEFTADEVEVTLRERLSRRSGLRLVDEPESGGLRLHVTACRRIHVSTGKLEVRRDPVTVLTPLSTGGFGEGRGNDTLYGVSAGSKDWVLLSVRLVWGDETHELVSGERDLSLEAAATTVAKALETLAKKQARRPQR